MNINNNEEEQQSADENIVMPYIDRVVLEAGGTAGDVSLELNKSDTEDDNSIWSETNNSDAGDEESSDEEMEYDSNEDSLYLEGHDPNKHNEPVEELCEASKELLLWRLDKDESFSNWTIEVSITDKRNSKKTYHVHKTSLGLGPKKSGYFEALLTSGQFSESSNSTSEVDLPEEIANYFTDFLDYLYAPPLECICLINRDNRLALQYLAKYFLIPKLTEDIYEFIEQDMINNVDYIKEYLTEAASSSVEDDDTTVIRAVASRVCVTNILQLTPRNQKGSIHLLLLHSLTPAMFLHIISEVRRSEHILKLADDQDKYLICCLALDYINHYRTSLDANYFIALASELYFPVTQFMPDIWLATYLR